LLFAFIGGALRAGVAKRTIIEACTDTTYKGNGIFEHVRENGGKAYVGRQIKHAQEKVTQTPRWRRLSSGAIAKSMHNARLALTALGAECSHDLFHEKVLVNHHGDNFHHELVDCVGEVSDHIVIRLRQIISDTFKFDPEDKATRDAVISLALEHRFNPVVDMLDKAEAEWDGKKRLDRMAVDYINCEDTKFNCAIFRIAMIALVRRARQPGCKFDNIVVLESEEGWNKSSALRVIAGDEENFSDARIIGQHAKEVMEQLATVWLHENAELSGMKKADVDMVKSFASRQVDIARPAYGRFTKKQPRHSVEFGTTNSDAYLQSQTGNRRFWPALAGC
jgi:hypothetical protein